MRSIVAYDIEMRECDAAAAETERREADTAADLTPWRPLTRLDMRSPLRARCAVTHGGSASEMLVRRRRGAEEYVDDEAAEAERRLAASAHSTSLVSAALPMLRAASTVRFRVCAVSDSGVSEFSEASLPIAVPHGLPGATIS